MDDWLLGPQMAQDGPEKAQVGSDAAHTVPERNLWHLQAPRQPRDGPGRHQDCLTKGSANTNVPNTIVARLNIFPNAQSRYKLILLEGIEF